LRDLEFVLFGNKDRNVVIDGTKKRLKPPRIYLEHIHEFGYRENASAPVQSGELLLQQSSHHFAVSRRQDLGQQLDNAVETIKH
jgi:hypothetical protein